MSIHLIQHTIARRNALAMELADLDARLRAQSDDPASASSDHEFRTMFDNCPSPDTVVISLDASIYLAYTTAIATSGLDDYDGVLSRHISDLMQSIIDGQVPFQASAPLQSMANIGSVDRITITLPRDVERKLAEITAGVFVTVTDAMHYVFATGGAELANANPKLRYSDFDANFDFCEVVVAEPGRKRGRPKGSKNKPKTAA